MSWKGEKQRHSLSSRGISNKDNLIQQRQALDDQIKAIERKEHMATLPDKVDMMVKNDILGWKEDYLKNIPLTDDEWDGVMDNMDIDDFVNTFYDGSYHELLYDNPMIMDFFEREWNASMVKDYASDVFDDMREDEPKYKDYTDEELYNNLSNDELQSLIINKVYERDEQHMFHDNPGIFDDLVEHWKKAQPYEDEARQYASKQGIRAIGVSKEPPVEFVNKLKKEALEYYDISEQEYEHIKRTR